MAVRPKLERAHADGALQEKGLNLWQWQWVRVGTFDLPDDAFRVRIVDPQGGLRVDQVLLTSDPELNPESK